MAYFVGNKFHVSQEEYACENQLRREALWRRSDGRFDTQYFHERLEALYGPGIVQILVTYRLLYHSGLTEERIETVVTPAAEYICWEEGVD